MNVLIFGAQREEQELITSMLADSLIDKVTFGKGVLSLENMECVKGYELVWIITNSIIGEKEAEKLKEYGVRFMVTRSAGTDHMDKHALKKCGIQAANVPEYSPGAISEHTVLLLLALLRNLKRSTQMTDRGDFSLSGLLGKEISSLTVGVVGCGRIGLRTMQILSSFGCQELVYSPHVKEEGKKYARFVTEEELFRQSDVVLLHCPQTEKNYHMINKETLSWMKEGSYLVNTARGGLVDTEAVLEALKSRKLAGYAFDVYEKEDDFIRKNCGRDGYKDPLFWELCDRDDVIYTAHTGFFTEEAVSAMRKITVENVLEYAAKGSCINEFIQ